MNNSREIDYNKECKYSKWSFTWNSGELNELPDYAHLDKFLQTYATDYVFQPEMGEDTRRLHLQGCFRLLIRRRKSTILKDFRDHFGEELVLRLRVDNMGGSWLQATTYCSKEESRVGDTIFRPITSEPYSERDIMLFEDTINWYHWQDSLYEKIFDPVTNAIKTANDRTIHFTTDLIGQSGKSKFVKYICHKYPYACKLPFGTASQIRSAVVAAGPKRLYFIDIPRTLGQDDSLESMFSAIEDIKNGFVVSAMYGKFAQLIFEPPHIVVFSNEHCPRSLMSVDRWKTYYINQVTYELEEI